MRGFFWSTLLHSTLAQFPSTPTDLTTVKSRVDPKVTISFKETKICERAAGVKSYSGFVRLPAGSIPDVAYDINTYFAYFESRNRAASAPLAIYLAGGPGESSLYAALSSENGPCYVNINGTDTINNKWSFNQYANVLYIDQPVQAGFSYDKLVNATFDLASNSLITPTDFTQSSPPPPVNASFGYGTYPSQNPSNTANTTVSAVKALWSFSEHWLSSFPGYATKSNKISVWGNSYGGYWVPETGVQLTSRIKSLPSGHALKAKNLMVDAIGITNGCIDIDSAIEGYANFAYNNTYGVRYGSEATYKDVIQNITMPGGVRDTIRQCRELGLAGDPKFTGSNATVNDACMQAFLIFQQVVILPFQEILTRNPFDIAQSAPPPCEFYLPVLRYLNTASVQKALGVPLNFTYNSNIVTDIFGFGQPSPDRPLSSYTADAVRQNGLANLEYLLANNVKVAFIFGDRDFRCPWTGGEATALATKWAHQADFAKAGYQEMKGIETPASQGGHGALVKQYGQFSFSRVLDSGHAVSAYAPETVYRIFERTIKGVDVATGQKSIACGYRSKGPTSSLGWRNTLPVPEPKTCMVAGQFQNRNPWDAVYGASN